MGVAGSSAASPPSWLYSLSLIANFDCCPRISARLPASAKCRAPDGINHGQLMLSPFHRVPVLFLQIATGFATIASMLSPSQPIQPGAENKLAALRRLDKSRAWNSLDDQLYCTGCKTVISGRQIEVVGGTNGLRALHLKCSTPGCLSTPADWILPVKSETVREIDFLFRDNGA